MKISDAQIIPLLDGEHAATARGALLVPAQHGSLGRRLRRQCRAKIAKILATTGNQMKDGKNNKRSRRGTRR